MVQARDYIQVGDVLADKYRVERFLGRGGMGMVIAVWHQDLHERRAIKLMLPEAAQRADIVERFLREARAATRLKSSHAVKVHDVARMPNGVPYIVMEYLEGMDLDGLLESRGPLPIDEACRYMLQACEAIGEAHALGIVHRDLKPANLFVTKGVRGEPFVKVLDFGIAKVARGADVKSPSITVAQTTMGTPAYMSPEQVSDSKAVDGRADIWSLGIILYQLTTGALPFDSDHYPVLFAKILDDRQMAQPPSRIRSAIPPEFDAVVLRCLQKNIHARYQTIAELVNALTPFAMGTQASAHAPAGNMFTLPMPTVRGGSNAQPPSIDHTTLPIAAPAGTHRAGMEPKSAMDGPTLQGGMVRTASRATPARNALVASVVVGSLIAGIAVWIMLAGGRNEAASEAVATPAISSASMDSQDKPTSAINQGAIDSQDKPTSENTASAPTTTPEVNPMASVSSAPKLSAPTQAPAPKPTGQKSPPVATTTTPNKEFNTRK